MVAPLEHLHFITPMGLSHTRYTACEINTCGLKKSCAARARGHFGNAVTFFLLINYHPVKHLLNDHLAAPFWLEKVGLPFFFNWEHYL